MEDPRPEIQAALKDAMKTQNKERRDLLRLLQSAFKQVEIDTRKELTAEDVIDVLQKEAKKRRETITDLTKAGRGDQIAQEEQELVIIEEFLPRQMTEEEVAMIVKEVIAEMGDVSLSVKEMGRVIGPVMQKVKGQADGKLVSKIVREQLNA
ncbi:MAG: GatB/YqeY domain-containing protein [Aggregatilineales bacterium]